MTCNKLLIILQIAYFVAVANVHGDNGMQGLGVSPIPQIPPVPRDPNSRCEEIKIAMCRGIGYNLTSFPNEMNHDTQEEAGLEANQFFPLVSNLVSSCTSDKNYMRFRVFFASFRFFFLPKNCSFPG